MQMQVTEETKWMVFTEQGKLQSNFQVVASNLNTINNNNLLTAIEAEKFILRYP